MKPKLTIVEKEVILETIDEITCEQIRLWRNQENVAYGFLNQGEISNYEQQLWYKAYEKKKDDQMFIIYWKKCPVGALALYTIDLKEKKAEFGRMMIGEEWARGRGIAKCAIEMICQYAFRDLGLEMLYLEVFQNNRAAYKLYEKVGFIETAIYEKNGQSISVMCLEKIEGRGKI